MRGRIQILPLHIRNRIAAGEVIQRPASVVKELIENALDAGADRIRLDIEDGGRKRIAVSDNGHGIPPDELELAVAPHATSKIADESDIDNIGTFGFRGEALASIGSVSRMKIISADTSGTAFAIEVNGDEISEVMPASGRTGTVIDVGSLFWNIPARRKFLKSPATEFSHIRDLFVKYSCANPDINLTLHHNQREVFNLNASKDLISRLREVLPEDMASALREIHSSDSMLNIHGFVTSPEYSSGSRERQYLFVNQRPIFNKTIHHALMQAFRDLLPDKRYPGAVLFIDVSTGNVDVNVHPAKTEVRFSSAGHVHDVLVGAIREKLLGQKMPASDIASMGRIHDVSKRSDSQPIGSAASFGKSSWTPSEKESQTDLFSREQPFPQVSDVRAAFDQAPAEQGPVLTVDNMYLVFRHGNDLVIMDQHAAHERYLYENLISEYESKSVDVQQFLFPVTVKMTEKEKQQLLDSAQGFQEAGFQIEDFGPEALAVHSIPARAERLDIETFLFQSLEIKPDTDPRNTVKKMLELCACHAAVRAGDNLSAEEISDLIDKWVQGVIPPTCPHGRPIVIIMDRKKLDKLFKRI